MEIGSIFRMERSDGMECKSQMVVPFGDTDAAQIVYYPNYYRYMDQATHDMFKKSGLSLKALQNERQIIVPLVEATCKFKTSLQHEDIVTIHSTIERAEGKVFHIRHEFKKEGDVLVAIGQEVRAWVSIAQESPKAIEIPETIKRKMKGMDE